MNKENITKEQWKERLSPKSYTIEDSIARFWTKVEKTENGCWVFGGKKGVYGQLRIGKDVIVVAHRFSWELHYGEIPDGLFVLHHCDNLPCVRPDHLFLGRQKDNIRDMFMKGRQWHGVWHGN